METRQRGNIRVLMFPWLAHGHISPFLELAKNLSTKNFFIYFCSTPVNLNSISPKKLSSPSIQLVELHLPLQPSLPHHYHTTKGLPPHLMTTLKDAFDMASSSFFNILKDLKPDLLIYDILQPWAPTLASSLNIPAVTFISSSVSTTSVVLHIAKNLQRDEFPFQETYPSGCMEKVVLQALKSSSNELNVGDRVLQSIERSSNMVLVKSFREVEGKYIDFLSTQLKKKIVPVGPLVEEDDELILEDKKIKEVMEWLEIKERSSTVFVSFGSEYYHSKEEREEIAHGLEISKVNFIWVVRFPIGEKTKLEEALPEGYATRIGERGRVIEGWAPQRKILNHCSIGGFVSHCGWSSIMESMKFGIPLIAMPMNLDQPLNAKLVEDIGVGIEVKRNESGGLEREDIAKIIRKVVMENGGEDVRRRARAISDTMRKKGDEEIDGVADALVSLCDM